MTDQPMQPMAPVVGRAAELRVVEHAIDQLLTDMGVAMAIYGDPGIGKSTILEHAARYAAAQGFWVLRATGVETETALPYAGLHQLLSQSMPDLAELADLAQLPMPQRQALLCAFGIETGAAPEPFLIGLAALNVLGHIAAEAPLVIVVDDVQWFDLPTQQALAFLARRIVGDRIAMVGTVRRTQAPAFLAACARQLDLRGLDDADSRDLVGLYAADLTAADRERILEQALGNPLALVELPAVWRQESMTPGAVTEHTLLSARLEQAFAARLDELPSGTRNALLIAAIDGGDELAEILAGTAALSGDGAPIDVLEPAADVGLLRFDDVRVKFRHPLVRSGILQAESLRRRHAAHHALAEVLKDDPYRRTWHRAQAVVGVNDDIADELEYNHTVSIGRGSVFGAIAALERSAQLTTDPATRGRRLLLAAEHAFGLGRADMVDRLLTAASRNVLSDLDLVRMEWLREIFDDGVPGDGARVLHLCAAARRAADAGDLDLALNLLLGAALRCWWADTGPQPRAAVVAETKRLGATSDPRYVAAVAVAEPVLQSRAVEELLSQFVLETVSDGDALRLLGMAAHGINDPARAIDFFDRAESRLREQGRLGLLSHVLTMGIMDRLELGDWGRMVAAADEAQAIARETGQSIWDTGTLSLTAMGCGLRGQAARAHELAARAEQMANGRRLNNLLACVQLARGYAFSSSGSYAEAYSALRRLFDSADPCYHQRERFHGIMYLAEAAVHAGKVEDARRVIADLEAEAQVSVSPTLHTQLSYARAVLADDDEAEGLFRLALDADLIRWPLTKARIELAYGSWLRRQRRVAESRLPLRSALTALDIIGATTWAEQARVELRAAGEATKTGELPAVHELLSPQELQIAQLAAEGLSNKQIGERMYLSPRTVGSHLYRIFPKLDITSRVQIATRLERM